MHIGLDTILEAIRASNTSTPISEQLFIAIVLLALEKTGLRETELTFRLTEAAELIPDPPDLSTLQTIVRTLAKTFVETDEVSSCIAGTVVTFGGDSPENTSFRWRWTEEVLEGLAHDANEIDLNAMICR